LTSTFQEPTFDRYGVDSTLEVYIDVMLVLLVGGIY